jgi:streptomycin 6-kinase
MARRSTRVWPARLLHVCLAVTCLTVAWLAAAAGPATAAEEAEAATVRIERRALLQADEEQPVLLTTVPAAERPGPR